MPSDESAALSRPLEGVFILILEDYEDARTLFAALLAMSGASVTAVANVPDAISACDRTRFDVIVSDLNLPEQDGFDFIEALRLRPPEEGGTTPAIAVTAQEEEAYRERAFAAGFQEFLGKPVDASDLVEVIVRLIGR